MNHDKKVKFLQEAIDSQIGRFTRSRRYYKRSAIAIKLVLTTLAAITTVLLGLQDTGNSILLKNAALCLTSLITLLSAWDVFFNYRAFWIRCNVTLSQFYELKEDLEYLLCDEIEDVREQDLDELYKRYRLIHSETNSNWFQLRKEYDSKQSN